MRSIHDSGLQLVKDYTNISFIPSLWLRVQSFHGRKSGQVPWTYGAPRRLVWDSEKCPV
jgi:hypothetical protein